MSIKKAHGTTTITLSIPTEMKSFFDEMADNGYNRSFLMLGMTKILKTMYEVRQDIKGGLHASIKQLAAFARGGFLVRFLKDFPQGPEGPEREKWFTGKVVALYDLGNRVKTTLERPPDPGPKKTLAVNQDLVQRASDVTGLAPELAVEKVLTAFLTMEPPSLKAGEQIPAR